MVVNYRYYKPRIGDVTLARLVGWGVTGPRHGAEHSRRAIIRDGYTLPR